MTSNCTGKKLPDSVQYADYVAKLASLATSLKLSVAVLGESENAWKEVRNKQKAFAESFALKYPDKDGLREFSKSCAAKSQHLVSEFVKNADGSHSAHRELELLVNSYLAEISIIQEQYRAITDLTTDLKIFEKKVEDLSKAKKRDDTKLCRNIEKMEEARGKYDAKLEQIVEQMRSVYDKRGMLLRAMFTEYWASQLRAIDKMAEALSDTRGYVASLMQTSHIVAGPAVVISLHATDLSHESGRNTTPAKPDIEQHRCLG